MRTRSRNPFTTVRTAGLLLPVDLLARIIEGDRDLPGLTPESYHLLPGERLNEAASRAWNRCHAAWKAFRQQAQKLPAGDTGTTLTRERWLLPLFQELGFGRLQAMPKGVEIDERSYPVSHGWGEHVPIHLVSFRYELDKRTPGVAGAATRSPYSMMQELLNRSPAHRWGFVCNGQRLVILRDNVALVRAANVEFDLEAMMEGEVYSDFTLLFLLCHQSRVEIPPDGKPEDCWLERWANQADEQGTRAREHLRDGVEAAIKALGAGFLTTRGNKPLRDRLRLGELSTQDYYRQLLRLVYRLLMLLVAEEKRDENGANLLHPPETAPTVRERYARFYSVGRVRQLAATRRGTAHPDLYESLKVLFERLRDGYPPLGIPGLGSLLFSTEATPDLDQAALANVDLLDCFRQLTYTLDTSGRGGAVRRPVDFANLGSEELGSVYESLLELHPRIDTDEGPFTLATAAGHERKTTGSYYTPTSLINCLLDSALDPVAEEALGKPDPEQALLDLKICDPACGSGHFLIAAAERLAKHLARVRTGEDEPSVLAIQRAKRDIIGRSIFGVDINPMAVELCKVSLWMEALTPGRPLSFLDAHIQCGNSLLGATPRLLREGIPDDAFNPIEGDDKKVCTECKKLNREERTKQKKLFDYAGAPAGKPWGQMGDLATALAHLDDEEDETVDAVRHKQDRYAEIVRGAGYLSTCFWADAWCAAFVWKKTHEFDYAITEDVFRRIERNPHDCPPWMRDEIQRLARQYQFFHWHLAFPQVFRVPADDEPENERTGWSDGFDVVLGNPPWETYEMKEKEWFAERVPAIASAQNTAVRRKMIAKLQDEDPQLYGTFCEDRRLVDATRSWFRDSGCFPLCAVGKLSTYPLFSELNRSLINSHGRLGIIVPCGIATDHTNRHFFSDLLATRALVALFGMINEQMLFPSVLHNFKFCLLVIAGSGCSVTKPQFTFNCYNVQEAADPKRRFSLTAADVALVNPDSLTCPVFFWSRSAELTKAIYRRVPILASDSGNNSWDVELFTIFNMSTDSDLFGTAPFADGVPLYEAKMLHQYNHRFASFENLKEGERSHMLPEVEVEQLSDPLYSPTPCYYVPVSQVTKRLEARFPQKWLVGFREITSAGLYRTTIYCVLPFVGAGHKLPMVSFRGDSQSLVPCYVACMNSFPLDFVARQKLGGATFSFFVKKQLPVMPTSQFVSRCHWDNITLVEWIKPRVLELTYSAWDLEPFARDYGYDGPPFRWNEGRRFLLRCELDAAFFHLYLGTPEEWQQGGEELLREFPTPRDAVDYIMETFPIVRRRDVEAHGTYRTKDQILAIYDQMAEAIRTGHPYQTLLDPPPADPRVAYPPRAQSKG